jgi:serine/threonine-protein kinase
LSQRQEELKSLVELFLNPDAKMVTNGAQAASSLSGLEGCANTAALMSPLRPPADAESRAKMEDLRRRIAKNNALQDAGKISEALPLAVSIAEDAKALHYRPIEAEALYRLSGIQSAAGDLKSAGNTLLETIFAAEAGGHTSIAAEAWSILVWVAGYRQGRYEDAKEYGKHALALIEHLGGNDRLLASLFTSLGSVVRVQGKYDEALDYQQRALKLRERVFGQSHPQVATTLGLLGSVLLNQGKIDEAIETYRRAIRIDEETLGPSHAQLANHLNNLGIALARQGKRDEAIVHLRRGLAILESSFGPSHSEVGMTHSNIASILLKQGHYDHALRELHRALEIQEKALGPEHVEVSHTLKNMADVFRLQEKHEQALNYYQRALAIKEKRLGTEHPDLAPSLAGIGVVYLSLRQPEKALPVLERAVAIRKDARMDPGSFFEARFALAQALGELHREPERARRLAVEAREAVVGKSELENEVKRIDAWLAKNYRRAN